MKQGYIKLYRKIKGKKWWRKQRFTWGQAWIDLLLRASHKNTGIILNNQEYKVPKGSFITSQRKLAKHWKWGIARVNRFLQFLQKTEHSIELKTEHPSGQKAEHLFSHIFILNWDKFQTKTEQLQEKKRNTKRNAKRKQNKNVYKQEYTSSNRRTITFKKEDYDLVLNKYQLLKSIELQGQEFSPVRQAIKSMFMSQRTPEQIIGCMEWLASLKADWASRWTINTVQKKLPEFVAGKFTKDKSWQYAN